MKCSIVIRAYNEAEHIGRLLEGISPALKKQAKPSKEEKPKQEEKPVTAADLGIGKGDDCRHAGKNWTIIRVSEDGLTVTLSNDDDEVRKGVKVADLQPPAGQDDIAPQKEEAKKTAKDEEDWDADFDDEPKKGKRK